MKQQESTLQASCVRWFRLQYPNYLIFAVPNGGSRNPIEAKRLKKEGTLAGVADLTILLPQGKTLFIEMKIKGNTQTDTQKKFQHNVQTLGFAYHVCFSLDEFKNIVRKEIE